MPPDLRDLPDPFPDEQWAGQVEWGRDKWAGPDPTTVAKACPDALPEPAGRGSPGAVAAAVNAPIHPREAVPRDAPPVDPPEAAPAADPLVPEKPEPTSAAAAPWDAAAPSEAGAFPELYLSMPCPVSQEPSRALAAVGRMESAHADRRRSEPDPDVVQQAWPLWEPGAPALLVERQTGAVPEKAWDAPGLPAGPLAEEVLL